VRLIHCCLGKSTSTHWDIWPAGIRWTKQEIYFFFTVHCKRWYDQ